MCQMDSKNLNVCKKKTIEDFLDIMDIMDIMDILDIKGIRDAREFREIKYIKDIWDFQEHQNKLTFNIKANKLCYFLDKINKIILVT